MADILIGNVRDRNALLHSAQTLTESQKAQARKNIDVYPIGSIYISTNNTSPASLFGGEWKQIKGQFLLAADSTASVTENVTPTYNGTTSGGSAKVTLTADEIAPHEHWVEGNDYITYLHAYKENLVDHFNGAGIAFEHAGYTAPNTLGDWSRLKAMQQNSGATAHENMPPYLAVYMWKRTK